VRRSHVDERVLGDELPGFDDEQDGRVAAE